MKFKNILACMLAFAFLALAGEASATHFRFGHLTWTKASGNTINVKVRQAWRIRTVGSICVSFDGGGNMCGGAIVATPTDLSGVTYEVWEWNFQHTFSSGGVHFMRWSSCCRISTLINAADQSEIVTTDIDLAQQGSTVSAITPILQWPQGPQSLTLPAADLDGGPISCRMATSAESAIPSVATTASGTLTVVSNSCVLSWDATTAAHAAKYAAQVILTQGGSDTALDFIIEINSGIAGNNSPSCTLNGPVNSSIAVGTPFSISVTATDPDGDDLVVNHLGLPSGATLTPVAGTSQASPATATFNWTPASPGVEAVTLTFTDPFFQTCQSSFSITVTSAPIADAGGDDMVNENGSFTLDGSASSDPDGDPLTYSWTQTAGPAVAFTTSTLMVNPTFTAPYVTTNQTATFELVVNDGSQDSAPDSVDITIKQVNLEPIADAGDDMSIKEGATKFLDGSGSFDPDSDPIVTYQWNQVSGTGVVLLGANTVNPSFVAPFGVGTLLVFQLQVNDGMEDSALSSLPDTNVPGDDLVTITVVANSAPIADAGPDQTKNEGIEVQLDGSGSSDPDGDPLTYQWMQTGGSTVVLSDSTIVNPTFSAPAVMAGGEIFTFKLTVTDNDPTNSKSDMDTVVITVMNINDPPDCSLAVPSDDNLWPPNHKMHQITINGVTDEADAFPTFTIMITGVTQDEPLNGTGDGDTSPDAVVQQLAVDGIADAVMIRAERAGGGDGRVYVISFIADDGFESCTGSVTVGVPHNKKDTPLDSGLTVDSEGL